MMQNDSERQTGHIDLGVSPRKKKIDLAAANASLAQLNAMENACAALDGLHAVVTGVKTETPEQRERRQWNIIHFVCKLEKLKGFPELLQFADLVRDQLRSFQIQKPSNENKKTLDREWGEILDALSLSAERLLLPLQFAIDDLRKDSAVELEAARAAAKGGREKEEGHPAPVRPRETPGMTINVVRRIVAELLGLKTDWGAAQAYDWRQNIAKLKRSNVPQAALAKLEEAAKVVPNNFKIFKEKLNGALALLPKPEGTNV